MVLTRANKRSGARQNKVDPLDFEGLLNFRSLGGMKAKVEGKAYRVKESLLYRCANPNHCTVNDFTLLRQLNVGYFVDLRNPFEIEKDHGAGHHKNELNTISHDHETGEATPTHDKPGDRIPRYSVDVFRHDDMRGLVKSTAPLIAKIEYLVWTLLCQKNRARAALMPTLNELGLLGMNKTMLSSEYTQVNLKRALDLITYGGEHGGDDKAVVINCTLGKDRTGLVTAVVLDVLGVSREDIIADYTRSRNDIFGNEKGAKLLRDVFKDLIRQGLSEDEFLSSREKTIVETLAHITEGWGSVREYLEKIGFTAKDQQALREKFLEKDH